MSTEKPRLQTIVGAFKRMSGDKKVTWLLILGLCGVVCIGLSSLFGGDKPTSVQPTTEYDAEVYTAALEERLAQMVSSIEGAGAAQIMVTLENGVEYIYANEVQTNSDHTQNDSGSVSVRDDSQKTVVTVDAGSGKEGLLVTEIQPTVRGVVVACEGAVNETVAALVKQAVKTALDISDSRVCVIPYSTEGV